jgi:excisionase family DNA binding protein
LRWLAASGNENQTNRPKKLTRKAIFPTKARSILFGKGAHMKHAEIPDVTTRDHLLTFEQVGLRLGVVTNYARRLADNGLLPKVKIGRRCVRIPSSAVEEFIAKRTVSTKGRAA